MLLFEADCVVRELMPMALAAAGCSEAAHELRTMPPLDDQSIDSAFQALEQIRMAGLNDYAFWCEAAIWAALRGDEFSFDDHVQRAKQTLSYELGPQRIH